jgi:hypothetical protein
MTEFWLCIGDCFMWSFKIIEKLNMLPNFIFMAIGGIAFLIWMNMQAKFNREAEETGGYK